ncbi:hypothetical protein HU200_053796 [Digitaria exilis]|uniref:[RNA-polymerase]-subunit kinase n=1 Tax=Digitaria exilis TaxID=1010633 RepID=A0A835ALN8_9POAL|nr:hypothetical protein HU200_053796 [Digitaria exilis]
MEHISAEEKEEPPEAKKEQLPCTWPAAMSSRYKLRNKLGDGMFGEVYKAWDRVGKRLVAVKHLRGRTGEGFVPTNHHYFTREATSLAACRGHPSIVKLVATHADGTHDIDGDFLRGHELLSGAKHVHKVGVLHRDMVPENVIVDNQSVRGDKMVYRIAGFGVSKPAVGAEKDGSGALASPEPYRAPELFLGSEDYDGRVDTWSLGCVMAELVTGGGGTAPFFRADVEEEPVFEKMLRLVGTKGILEWPALKLLARRDVAAELREKGCGSYAGGLRDMFPEEKLSEAGFEVLSGLLEPNPERRLTAAAALRKPWFRRRGFGGGCFAP